MTSSYADQINLSQPTSPSPSELFALAFDRDYCDLETKLWVNQRALDELVETIYASYGGAVSRDYIGQALRRMVEVYPVVPMLVDPKVNERLSVLARLRQDEEWLRRWRV